MQPPYPARSESDWAWVSSLPRTIVGHCCAFGDFASAADALKRRSITCKTLKMPLAPDLEGYIVGRCYTDADPLPPQDTMQAAQHHLKTQPRCSSIPSSSSHRLYPLGEQCRLSNSEFIIAVVAALLWIRSKNMLKINVKSQTNGSLVAHPFGVEVYDGQFTQGWVSSLTCYPRHHQPLRAVWWEYSAV